MGIKKLFALLLTLSLLLPLPVFAVDQADLIQKIDDLSKELDRLKQQMQEIQKQNTVKEQRINIVEKKAEQAAGPSWLEIGGDYRFRFDSLSGKVPNYYSFQGMQAALAPAVGNTFTPAQLAAMMPGMITTGYTVKNDSLLTNRFGLNLKAKATEDVQVKARLLMYKVWGHETSGPITTDPAGTGYGYFADRSFLFDGTAGHVPSDEFLRVDQAYATWSNMFGAPMWFSVGRRPSTVGAPTNIRQNSEKTGTAGVPGHMIDYAFDGGTLGVAPDIAMLPGAYAKLCYGKGYDSGFKTPANNTLKDVNFLGINVVPYDTENLLIELQWNRGFDIFDNPNNMTVQLGDIDGFGLLVSGKIGSLNLFGSAVMSKTHPNDNQLSMPAYYIDNTGTVQYQTIPLAGLMYDGANKESRTGSSYYVGARYDIASSGTKIGAEYNYGSKYWITFAPASDDMWTSKLGTRGSVYEAYIIQQLNKKPIAKRGDAYFRLGYQYYDFQYTGSNSWLGEPKKISDLTADPNNAQLMTPIKNAHDIYLTFDVVF
jgi:hypothetical protein